ncbi:hypothetical protein RCL1_008997 [Eukaryota sp. TZLM3-RCL]
MSKHLPLTLPEGRLYAFSALPENEDKSPEELRLDFSNFSLPVLSSPSSLSFCCPNVTSSLVFDDKDFIVESPSAGVFKARFYGSLVNVKVFTLPKAFFSTFLNEITPLTSLTHPFLLPVYGYSILLSFPQSYSAKTLTYAIQITSALQFLHSRNLIHGNLKPDNIFLSGDTVKIAGYGLVKTYSLVSTYSDEISISKFAAPEVFDGVYSKAGDVYSLGLVLLELFANRKVFEDMSAVSLLKAKFSGDRIETRSFLPEAVQSVIASCLDPNKSSRPSIDTVTETLLGIQSSGFISESESPVRLSGALFGSTTSAFSSSSSTFGSSTVDNFESKPFVFRSTSTAFGSTSKP